MKLLSLPKKCWVAFSDFFDEMEREEWERNKRREAKALEKWIRKDRASREAAEYLRNEAIGRNWNPSNTGRGIREDSAGFDDSGGG